MPSWWQEPYKGATPPKGLPPLPRPLYPPSAVNKGHTPSKDGPDVVAIKRAISRAGRWPWQNFDDSYSDKFALGNPSSQVENSGVAGFQRQQFQGEVEDTGFVGTKTYNALTYALVPEGRQHAGEPLFDSKAIELLNQAWDMFGGKEEQTPGPLTRKPFPSPNYSSRGGAKVRLIVIHTAEGATTIESLGSYFANPSVDASSHVGIDDKLGVVGEYVKRDGKAWTQASANPVCISVELCGFAKWSASEWNKHPNMLENCARWIAEEARQFGIPITKLTASQAQGSGKGVCQHADLGAWGGGHWDCGNAFPLDSVLDRAKEL
ncbi:MAG TPA: N-acetylmuramoyl-L-alanine amidase [Gemmataceae bacterium]|nr:N-acetylmuramoyl-L-alanine amidase [Gemmataceae bacterium]